MKKFFQSIIKVFIPNAKSELSVLNQYVKTGLDIDLEPIYNTKIEGIKMAKTLEEVLVDTGTKAEAAEIAKILVEMKTIYTKHVADLAAKVFAYQDTLGLSAEELKVAVASVIDLKDSVVSNAQKVINAVTKSV